MSINLLILLSTVKQLYEILGLSNDCRKILTGFKANLSAMSCCTKGVAEAVNAIAGMLGNSSLSWAMRK